MEPRPALLPPNGLKRFHVVVDGVSQSELIKAWSELMPARAISRHRSSSWSIPI